VTRAGSPSGLADRGDELLVFVHIPRTAGSTFVGVLDKNYGAEAVLRLYGSTFGEELRMLASDELSRVRAVTGHFYFGLHVDVSRPCRYVTFVRDPVSRIVSHYHFVRGQPDHYLHDEAFRLSLGEYVRFCGAAEPNNDQTRLLAGREMAASDGTSSADMLPVAKRNLDRHAVVGLTEAFDASLLLMRNAFGWKRALYVQDNVGTRRHGRPAVDEEVRELIREHNALDLELFRYAREAFERQLSAQGDGFHRELRRFRQLNALYARVAALRRLPSPVPTRARR
jgi:hypothetical protein